MPQRGQLRSLAARCVNDRVVVEITVDDVSRAGDKRQVGEAVGRRLRSSAGNRPGNRSRAYLAWDAAAAIPECRLPDRIATVFLPIPQRPPHFRRVGFRPPAIQLRKINAAIDEHFHPARSTDLPGPAWRVDPYIYPLHQVLGQKHVVVTEEDHMRAHIGAPNKMDPFPKVEGCKLGDWHALVCS